MLKGDCAAIDGSKLKAVNNRDKNFTKSKIASRLAHLEADVARYVDDMVRIDRQEEGEARADKVTHLRSFPHSLGRPYWREFAAAAKSCTARSVRWTRSCHPPHKVRRQVA